MHVTHTSYLYPLGSSHQQQIEFWFMGATRIDILFEIQLNLESAGCQLHANSC